MYLGTSKIFKRVFYSGTEGVYLSSSVFFLFPIIKLLLFLNSTHAGASVLKSITFDTLDRSMTLMLSNSCSLPC